VSTEQLLIIAILSAVVTLPAVWLIPKARHSPVFDRLLWAGTWVMAFLGAWYALGNFTTNLASVNVLVISDIAVIPALLGAAASAVFLNGLLWAMDRFSPAQIDDDAGEADSSGAPNPPGTIAGEGGNGGTDTLPTHQE